MVKNHRKPKKGNFANAYRPPEKNEGGLDWAAIMRCHRPEGASEPLPQNLQLSLEDIDRRNRGLQNNYENRGSQAQVKGGKKGRAAPFDVDEVVRLYTEEKMLVSELALKMGCSPSTIIRYLKKAKAYIPNRDKGKNLEGYVRPKESYSRGKTGPRKDECIRGHDVTQPGSRYNNGKCVECTRETNRQYYSWAKDPRNPKNGGKAHSQEVLDRRTERKKRLREACFDESCGHRRDKHHPEGCEIRRCECKLTDQQVHEAWEKYDG